MGTNGESENLKGISCTILLEDKVWGLYPILSPTQAGTSLDWSRGQKEQVQFLKWGFIAELLVWKQNSNIHPKIWIEIPVTWS